MVSTAPNASSRLTERFFLKTEVDIQSNESGGSVSIIVEELVACMNKELDQLPVNNPENGDDKPWIFRVPHWLHNKNETETAYAPISLSFGPYHHSAVSETNKLCYVRDANIQSMDIIIENIWQVKERAKSYYSESINMEDKQFVLILFRDACCMLKVFGSVPVTNGVADTENEQSDETSAHTEHIQYDERVVSELAHDLVLLENQVPFLILEKVFEVECPDREVSDMLQSAIVCAKFIIGYLSPEMMVPRVETLVPIEDIHHFLHLCHIYISPKQDRQGKKKGVRIQWFRAVEYREAGVRLKKRKLRHKYSLLDIEFKNGMLLIPCFVIDENVDYIIRNLLAFEQCTKIANHVTAYITFMSHLANKTEDVALLCKKGIIEKHVGGEEDVSRFFINLSSPLMFDPHNEDYYLKSLSIELEKRCKSRVSKWVAWLRHNYNHPWLILGALFLLLTAFNTVVQLVKHFTSKPKSD